MAVSMTAMLALSACTPQSTVVEGTSVSVAVGQGFTSYNPNTAFGSATPTNASIFEATNSSFASYDENATLVDDESFGSYEVVSTEPLVVTYTVRDGIRWSDGTPIDAADLLLAWAANSTSLNDPDVDPAEFIDPGTGQFTEDFPRDVVYFDGFTGNGLQLVTQVPTIGDDGRSITMAFDEYFADWQLVFDLGLPAHVVAGQALDIEEPQAAKDALVAAIEDGDRSDLAPISRFWNSGFNLAAGAEEEGAEEEDAEEEGTENKGTEHEGGDEGEAGAEATGIDSGLMVGSGPYVVSEVTPGEVTLSANPEYRGNQRPQFEEVVVTFISDPLQAVAALDAGEVDIVAPQATEDVTTALDGVEGAGVDYGFSGTWERLDLQMSQSKNGFIENDLVRQAFLHTVPREQIIDSLIRPISPDAELRDSHVFLPGTKGYQASIEGNGSSQYDRVSIGKAKRLLAEAAQSSPTLAAPTVCLLFDPANPRRIAEFNLIKASAGEAGITVTNCSSPDWRNLLGTPGSYDAALYALRETNLAVSAVNASFASDSELNNHGHYANPEADALLADASAPASAGERRELLAELDALLWQDAVGMPLYHFPTVTATSDQVSGVIRSPFARTVLWDPWRWKPATEG